MVKLGSRKLTPIVVLFAALLLFAAPADAAQEAWSLRSIAKSVSSRVSAGVRKVVGGVRSVVGKVSSAVRSAAGKVSSGWARARLAIHKIIKQVPEIEDRMTHCSLSWPGDPFVTSNDDVTLELDKNAFIDVFVRKEYRTTMFLVNVVSLTKQAGLITLQYADAVKADTQHSITIRKSGPDIDRFYGSIEKVKASLATVAMKPRMSGSTFHNPWPGWRPIFGSIRNYFFHGLKDAVIGVFTGRTKTDKQIAAAIKPPVLAFSDSEAGGNTQCIWTGHAGLLCKVNGLTVAFDPISSLKKHHLYPPSKSLPVPFQKVDVIAVTHGHTDHLDIGFIKRLVASNPNVHLFMPKGLESFTRKETGSKNVVGLVWGERLVVPGTGNKLEMVAVVCQHWSFTPYKNKLKIPFTMGKSLATAWFARGIDGSVDKPTNNGVLTLGDTGYTHAFSKTGDQFEGEVGFLLTPIGSFKPRRFFRPWHQSPIDAVQTARDFKPKATLAMHFGTFVRVFSQDLMHEGVETIAKEAKRLGMSMAGENLSPRQRVVVINKPKTETVTTDFVIPTLGDVYVLPDSASREDTASDQQQQASSPVAAADEQQAAAGAGLAADQATAAAAAAGADQAAAAAGAQELQAAAAVAQEQADAAAAEAAAVPKKDGGGKNEAGGEDGGEDDQRDEDEQEGAPTADGGKAYKVTVKTVLTPADEEAKEQEEEEEEAGSDKNGEVEEEKEEEQAAVTKENKAEQKLADARTEAQKEETDAQDLAKNTLQEAKANAETLAKLEKNPSLATAPPVKVFVPKITGGPLPIKEPVGAPATVIVVTDHVFDEPLVKHPF